MGRSKLLWNRNQDKRGNGIRCSMCRWYPCKEEGRFFRYCCDHERVRCDCSCYVDVKVSGAMLCASTPWTRKSFLFLVYYSCNVTTVLFFFSRKNIGLYFQFC